MMIKEHESLAPKTTMRIGGDARYFAELETKEDVEKAYEFAQKKNIPLIALGAGSNTIFADGEINALVVRIKANAVKIEGNKITVEAGKNLAQLVNELAENGLDLSPLTGIPGTVGGAVFGNAGQGPKGIWIDSFIENVEVFENKSWKIFLKDQCKFGYRDSIFKWKMEQPSLSAEADELRPSRSGKWKVRVIWKVKFNIPKENPVTIKNSIETLLRKRISSQPFAKTAGSCFTVSSDGTPAWQLIDKAGLRGLKIGGVKISEKHANFLINDKGGNLEDVIKIIETVKDRIPNVGEVEMRLFGENGQHIC